MGSIILIFLEFVCGSYIGSWLSLGKEDFDSACYLHYFYYMCHSSFALIFGS